MKALVFWNTFAQWIRLASVKSLSHKGSGTLGGQPKTRIEGTEADDTFSVGVIYGPSGSGKSSLIQAGLLLAVSLFMRNLEIRLVEGHNCALVDQFNKQHARKVLSILGRAYGQLDDDSAKLAEPQDTFIKAVIDGLAKEGGGKVVCVQLAMLAEMMKDRPWTPDTLRAVGGTKGTPLINPQPPHLRRAGTISSKPSLLKSKPDLFVMPASRFSLG